MTYGYGNWDVWPDRQSANGYIASQEVNEYDIWPGRLASLEPQADAQWSLPDL